MLKKIIISFSFLLTQFLTITQVQALPGYTDYDTKVRNTVGCGQTNINCFGTFIQGKPVHVITAYCWRTMCPQIVGATYAGNDILQVYQQYLSQYSQWINSNTYPKLEFISSLTSQSANIYFTVNQIRSDNVFAEAVTYSPLPINCEYNEALGCADDNLDRTSMEDGPCDICSKIGNPFDVRNGAKYEYATDIDFPIALVRNYSSKQRVPGLFGANWRTNFDKGFSVIKNNGIITSLLFITPTGQYVVLQSNNGTTFTPLFPDQKQYKVSIDNNQAKLRKPDGSYEIYDIISQKILSETNQGKTLSYQYYANGLLQKIVDSFGRYIQFSYNSSNSFVSQVSASNGDSITYTYDLGNVTHIKYNNIPQITYEYYNGKLLTGKRDGNNIKYASFTYDALGRGIENKWITSNGTEIKKYTVSYDSNHTNVTQSNGFSRDYENATFASANKVKNMSWNGVSEQVMFDTTGNVLTKVDLNGAYENYTYDSDNKITSYLRNSKNIELNWDNERNIVNQINENTSGGTRTTNKLYDDKNNDLGYKIMGGGSEAYLYKTRDTYGRLTKEENDQGLIKNYVYYPNGTNNESGLLKSITANTGATVLINSYDTRGNPTSISVNGVTKTMTYDYKGRILTETLNGSTNTYTYDLDGNILTSTMANGYVLSMTYDTAGRLLSIADNAGGSSVFTPDDYTGEILNTQISQNNTLVRARNKIIDTLGRTVESWNATTRTKQYTNYYTRATTPDSTTDSNGITTNYAWNTNNQNTSYSTGSDNATKEYDVDGNLSDILVNGQATSMNYDELGRIIFINSPDTGTRSYTYSKTQDTYTDAKGTVHTITKGIGGLPVSVTHINNDPDLNYSNYESYNYDTYGQVTQIQSNNAEVIYTRNNLGQLTQKSQNMMVSNYMPMPVNYGYNSIGQKITDTYPSGLVVTYGYTKGMVTSISVNGTPVVSNVQYNSMLQEPIAWTLGGNQVTLNKDTDGLLTSFVDNGVINQSVTTDNEGNVKSMTDTTSNNSFNINLNDNYSLDSGTINGKNLDYTFGSNHNISWQKDGITNYEFEYIYGTNKVESLYYGGTDTHFNYQYDANGNLRIDHKANYKYDGKNRLEYFTDKDGNYTRYYYNGLNQRIAKWIQDGSGQIRYFVYNESNQLIGEYNNSGVAVVEYVYFGSRPVAVKVNGSLNIVHTDYLGTPRVITSGTNGGSIVWQWKNDNPYGSNKAQGTIEFNLRFAGQYYDKESGLHDNINRTYDPETGRYLQSDPIGLAGGFNTYNYVGKNPLNNVDPLGLIEWGDYSLPQGLVNYITKVGDVSSIGISYIIRNKLNLDQSMYINDKWKVPTETEIECFIEKDNKTKSGFYRGNPQYTYNNSYAIAEHYDFSRFMASNLGIIGVGIMIIEIPGYNLSKNLVPFLHDDVTSPPTWIDVKYSFKGLKDGFMEMLNENRKAMAGNLHNN